VFGVPAAFAAVVLVSLVTRPPGPQQARMLESLRKP
jgi:Na+(H+)/acetate symporter ActP